MGAPIISSGYEIGFATDPGRKRHGGANQDALEVVLPGHGEKFPPLLVLADGMGGHQGGGLASALVLDAFRATLRTAHFPADNQQLLQICVQEAHRLILARGSEDPAMNSMGSTVVAALLDAGTVHIINVGDSRAYRMNARNLLQLSEDQSWVGDNVRAGLLTQQEALKHPQRNRLTMALSAKRPEVRPFYARSTFDQDDAIILCSDGLWGVVPETLIWAAVNEMAPQEAAEKLVAQANISQGPDNISVIIARRYQPGRVRPVLDLADTNPG